MTHGRRPWTRAVLAHVIASLCAACPLAQPPAFGAACTADAQCGGALRCNLDLGRCVPRPTDGATCDTATPLDAPGEELLLHAETALVLTTANTASDDAVQCARGQVHFVALQVPPRTDELGTPIEGAVLRVRATSDAGASLALLDDRCGEVLDHACAPPDAEGVAELVLPLVPAAQYRIAVSVPKLTDDARIPVQLEVDQLPCPPGFLPEGDGCRGFVAVPGTTPRTSHAMTALSSTSAAVLGGRTADGSATSDVGLFDRRLLVWRPSRLETARGAPCATVTPEGVLLVVGGANTVDGEIASAGVRGFVSESLFDSPNALSADDCMLLPLSSQAVGVALGGPGPLLIDSYVDRFAATRTCDWDGQCRVGERCIARVGATPPGVCMCFQVQCEEKTLEFIGRSIPAGERLNHVRGAFGVGLPGAEGDAAALVLGGVGEEGPIKPLLFFERDGSWVPTSLTFAPRAFGHAELLGESIVIAGGRDVAGDVPLEAARGGALVEIFDLGRGTTRTASLARPRRDAAMVRVGPTSTLIIGGREDLESLPLRTTERIDATTGAVMAGPVLPFAVAEHRAVDAGGEVLVAGGVGADGLLVEDAALLIRTPPGLRMPPLASLLALAGGDACEDAAPLEDLGGGTGSIETSTTGRAGDFIGFLGCPDAAQGLDATFSIGLAAGETLHATATAFGRQSLVVSVVEECSTEGVNAAACASEAEGVPTSVTYQAAVDRRVTIVVDRYVADSSGTDPSTTFAFQLDWRVETP